MITGANCFFAYVKSFHSNITISGNFVLSAKNSSLASVDINRKVNRGQSQCQLQCIMVSDHET